MAAWIDQPAIVELFGHTILAGRITEEEHVGTIMLRVDVPEVNGATAFTKFFGSGAIYGTTPTDEGTMLAAARSLRSRPISLYIEPDRQLSATTPERDYGDDDF